MSTLRTFDFRRATARRAIGAALVAIVASTMSFALTIALARPADALVAPVAVGAYALGAAGSTAAAAGATATGAAVTAGSGVAVAGAGGGALAAAGGAAVACVASVVCGVAVVAGVALVGGVAYLIYTEEKANDDAMVYDRWIRNVQYSREGRGFRITGQTGCGALSAQGTYQMYYNGQPSYRGDFGSRLQTNAIGNGSQGYNFSWSIDTLSSNFPPDADDFRFRLYCADGASTESLWGTPEDGWNATVKRDWGAKKDPVRKIINETNCRTVGGEIKQYKGEGLPYTQAAVAAEKRQVEVPRVVCPEGETFDSQKVTETAPDNPEVPTRTLVDVPPVVDPDANPCSPASGLCEVEVWTNPSGSVNTTGEPVEGSERCGVNLGCAPSELNAPDAGTRYDCFGTNPAGVTTALPWDACAPLRDVSAEPAVNANPRPDVRNPPAVAPENAPTNQNGEKVRPDGTPYPYQKPVPRPTTPGTGTGTGTGTTPTPGAGGGTIGNPRDPTDCAPSGLGEILNPLSYVRGMGCVLVWAFVPQNPTGPLRTLVVELQDKPPFSIVIGAVRTAEVAISSIDVSCRRNLEFGPISWPCQNPLGQTGVYLRNAAGVIVVLGTFVTVSRILNAGIGREIDPT